MAAAAEAFSVSPLQAAQIICENQKRFRIAGMGKVTAVIHCKNDGSAYRCSNASMMAHMRRGTGHTRTRKKVRMSMTPQKVCIGVPTFPALGKKKTAWCKNGPDTSVASK